jgi:hypothetical protein
MQARDRGLIVEVGGIFSDGSVGLCECEQLASRERTDPLE